MGDTPSQTKGSDEVVVFLHEVHREGLISDTLADTLHNYRVRQVVPVHAPVPVAATPHPAFAPRQPQPMPTPAAPQPTRQPAPAPVPRPPKLPSRTELWARFAKKRSKKLWGTFTADFAANALTYFGVLLSVIVIFVFFSFGYFGDFIDADHKEFRPLVEIGVVGFFLGLAWVLRHRTGIPQTSAAIEMIGIILIPIMLSASVRDGCTPSYRPWCLPPDVDGPARWAAYGLVGLISTAIYYLYARRRQIYAYLIGPMIWVSIGAFALYFEDGIGLYRDGTTLGIDRFTSDGISAPQLIAVIAAIGITITIAARIRNTRLGQLLSTPIVRSGILFTPLILVLSLVFSHNDAVARGITTPTLADLAWPNLVATAIAAFVFGIARHASFAWAAFPKRLHRDISLALEAAAYLSLAAAWMFTAGFGVTVSWLGTGLVGYAIVIAAASRILGDSGTAALWIVRSALVTGAALSLIDPGASLVAWGTLGVLAVARTNTSSIGQHIARFVPVPELAIDRRVQLWIPTLVATGAGAGRLGWPDATSFILLIASILYVATRLVPQRFADVRSFAGVPAAVVAASALAMEIANQVWGSGLDPYLFSGFLLGLAAVTAFMTIPTSFRVGGVAGLIVAAAMVALRELIGTSAWDTAWIDTSVLAVAGIALVAAALVKPPAPLFVGALGHFLLVAAAMRSLVFEETAILGLAVLATAHAVEAVRIETSRSSVMARIAKNSGPDAELIRTLPAFVALVSLAPITVLAGRQLAIVVTEIPRFGPLLAILSWLYLVAALPAHARTRRVAVPLAYTAAAAAIVAGVPSVTASLITTSAAAALTAVIAVGARRPAATVPSWILVVAAALLTASRTGVNDNDLHLVIHLLATALVLGAAAANQLQGRWMVAGWLRPPALLGSALLPVALLATIADDNWVSWVAISAAAAYTYLGWSTRIGGFSIPVAIGISVAYGSALHEFGWANPVDEPLVWMPLAAAFIAAAVALPGRHGWRITTDAAPGMLLSGLALGAIAVDRSRIVGMLDIALVAMAMLLIGAYIVKRQQAWLVGSSISLVAAGLVAGDYWAPLATFVLALVTGYLADHAGETGAAAPLRGVSTASLAATFALFGSWQQWSTPEIITYTSIVAGVLLSAASVAELLPSISERIRVWRAPIFLLSQLGVAAVIGVAVTEFSGSDAAGVIAVVVAFEAIVAGIVGTLKQNGLLIIGSAFLAAAAYSLVPQWQSWTHNEFVMFTGVVAAALAVLATTVTRFQATSGTAQLWLRSLHSLSVAAAAAIILKNSEPDIGAAGQWTIAIVLFGLAASATANAWAAPRGWRLRTFAVGGYVASAVFAIAAETTRNGAIMETVLVVSGLGLLSAIVAGLASETDSPWRLDLVWLSGGLGLTALWGVVSSYGTAAIETGIVLIAVGSALAAYGVLARNLAPVEGALIAWLLAFVVLINEQIGMSLHAAVLVSSIVLLGVVELERIRRAIEELPVPAVLHHIEWGLMLAPLTLATVDMFQSLWFGLVLLVEGFILTAWGTLTEVRRRAALGVGAMVLAIVLSIVIPALHGLMAGLTGGTWLVVGAIAATVFIIAGSAIERQRHAIGRQLSQIAEILEHWN